MKTKDSKKIYMFFSIIVLFTMLIIIAIIIKNNSYAKEENYTNNDVKISNAKNLNIYKIIEKNTDAIEKDKEKIEKADEVLEFITKYKTNNDLPKGTMQVVQEGREGMQEITYKRIYDINGELKSEEQINARITKASIDKIVEIGGANYSSSYKIKIGDNVYVTSDRAAVLVEPDISSQKIATLHRNDELKVNEIIDEWYKISTSSATGWVKQESATYINPNEKYDETTLGQKSKEQLMSTLGFDMSLNKPSGLSLEQFKKVLTDDKDKNKIFENNAEYFYYIEKQYNINGLFVAAIGIHESAWGTSKIARDKTNLFGYGAYDSNPYNGAYTFASYSESIDLMARVLTKYYLNPAGTAIYNSEIAKGTYYNGATFTGVNTRYATDKNWANAVYNHMKYLYEKI